MNYKLHAGLRVTIQDAQGERVTLQAKYLGVAENDVMSGGLCKGCFFESRDCMGTFMPCTNTRGGQFIWEEEKGGEE